MNKLTGLLECAFIAHEEMQYPAFLEFYHRLFILIIGISSILIFNNPIITLAAFPLSTFTMFALGFKIFISKYGWPDFKVEYVFIKDSLITAIPFFIMIILTKTYNQIGIILLTYLKGEGAAGIFSASDRLWVTVASSLAMLRIALFPVMSKFSKDSNKLFKLSERFIRIVIILQLTVSLNIIVLSKQIILIN